MIVAALILLLAVVNGQNCATKFDNGLKRSKLRQLCKKDDGCVWANDSGPGKKRKTCVDKVDVEGVKDCSTIQSQVNCPKSVECAWITIEGQASCRNICSRLSGNSFQNKKKKMCSAEHNTHCRWRQDENVCYDVETAPTTCNQILKAVQCRADDKCEWIKVNGDKRGCRKIVQASRCDDIIDRQQCRKFDVGGRSCHWETFPVPSCFDDEAENCESIRVETQCKESQDRYGFNCFWNGRGEDIYEQDGKMNANSGLPVDRCNNFPPCESLTSQGQCEANTNMVGGSCYWNPVYVGGEREGQSTAPYQCKEADCTLFEDKKTCKHFGCYWARKFAGWDDTRDNEKEEKKGLRSYQCQNP